LFEFIDDLRTNGFNGHINLFGFFATLAYPAILETSSAIDSIALGECETSLIQLAEHLENRCGWQDIPGLAFRMAETVGTSGHRIPESNPDTFAFPWRHLTAGDTVSILASRGCYNHCSFCPIPAFYNRGPLWRGRSPQNVVQEIRAILAHEIRSFYFVDPNFIGPGKKGKRRILELARLLDPLNISFGMETRPNDLDAELLDHLASAGLNSLLLGIESGSKSVLTRLNKGASLNAGETAIALCRAAGIEPEIGFLMFVPDSTLTDLEHNLEFLARNHLLDRLDRTANLLSHYQIVLAGTSGYTRFKTSGRLTLSDRLGFEGAMAYTDKRVHWISQIMIHACRYVLRHMSRPESPIYWQRPDDGLAFRRVNDYLVNLFKELLVTVKQSRHLAGVTESQTTIENQLEAEISPG
jgi:radical SAM superfamily enzyme YgiQ (UPF0313 family)